MVGRETSWGGRVGRLRGLGVGYGAASLGLCSALNILVKSPQQMWSQVTLWARNISHTHHILGGLSGTFPQNHWAHTTFLSTKGFEESLQRQTSHVGKW